jgi:thiol-disulfide isomerase/thioredoxin
MVFSRIEMRFHLILAKLLVLALFAVSTERICAQQIVLRANCDIAKIKLQKVVVKRENLAQYSVIIDTLFTPDSQFLHNSNYEEPFYFKVKFYFTNNEYREVRFWATEGEYIFIFDENLEPKIERKKDSEFNEKLNALKVAVAKEEASLEKLLKNISYQGKQVTQVEAEMEKLSDSVAFEIDEKIYKKYVIAYPDNPIALYALIKYAESPAKATRLKNNPMDVEYLYNQMSKNITAMPSAQLLLDKLKVNKQMVIGHLFADIKLPDNKGIIQSIEKYKGNYLLIDFWASWCSPCREETPYLKSAFKKYGNKGFHIVAISLDNNVQPWKSAIAKDGTGLWTQLLDKNEISRQKYAVKYIPENYLLDPAGKIIARNLRGNNLEKLLEKLFKD